MDVLPETRKKIRILVTQPYKGSRVAAQFSPHTAPDSLVSFPPYVDTQHQHLRRLHDKAVQAVPVVTNATCQSSMQVPFSRWVATGPLEASEDTAAAPVHLSAEVIERLVQGVEETSAVDVLGDDWGGLEKKIQVPDLKSSAQPRTRTGGAAPSHHKVNFKEQSSKELAENTGRKIEDSRLGRAPADVSVDDEALTSGQSDERADVLNLQAIQIKMVKKFNDKRAAEMASESRVDRFFRHLEIQKEKLNFGNNLKEEKNS